MLPDTPRGGGETTTIGVEVPTFASFVNDARVVIDKLEDRLRVVLKLMRNLDLLVGLLV